MSHVTCSVPECFSVKLKLKWRLIIIRVSAQYLSLSSVTVCCNTPIQPSSTKSMALRIDTQTTMFSEDKFPHTGAGMVGLSDPQLSQGRRRMLDLVNRLHSTGSIISFFFFFNKAHWLLQCPGRHRHSPNCRHRSTERWEVVSYWSNFWDYTA